MKAVSATLYGLSPAICACAPTNLTADAILSPETINAFDIPQVWNNTAPPSNLSLGVTAVPFEFSSFPYKYKGFYDQSQRLPFASHYRVTSEYVQTFLDQKTNIEDATAKLRAGTYHEGYWQTVKMSLRPWENSSPWSWQQVSTALQTLMPFMQRSQSNVYPMIVGIKGENRQDLVFRISVVETVDFIYPVPSTTTASAYLMGSTYPTDEFPKPNCDGTVYIGARWARAHEPDDIVPVGDFQMFTEGGIALTTVIGSLREYPGISYRQYEDYLRALLKFMGDSRDDKCYGLKAFLVLEKKIFGTIEFARGQYNAPGSWGASNETASLANSSIHMPPGSNILPY